MGWLNFCKVKWPSRFLGFSTALTFDANAFGLVWSTRVFHAYEDNWICEQWEKRIKGRTRRVIHRYSYLTTLINVNSSKDLFLDCKLGEYEGAVDTIFASLCLRRICIFTFDLLKSNRTEENPLAAIFNKRRVIYANIMVCNIYMSKYICIIFEIYRVNHAIGSGCSSDFVENKKNL